MSILYVFFGFIPLLLVIGAIFGWLAFFKTRELETQIERLNEQIKVLRLQLPRREDPPKKSARPQRAEPSVKPARVDEQAKWQAPKPTAAPKKKATTDPGLIARLRESWMIWLGGASIGLAGIFMVRYSIEQGLLGPTGRIVLAIITGLLFHGGAEYMRRRRGSQPAFAALAGGASITLYAALLAALHLYQLLSPGTTFMLLVTVSLATMALAVLHGPALAIIGILGGYVVPILVSTGSGNIVFALIYSLILSAAALLLMRYVYRPWIWLGMLAGAVGWCVLALGNSDADAFRGVHLGVLAYLILALPRGDWRLREAQALATEGPDWFRQVIGRDYRQLQSALLLLLALMALSLFLQPFNGTSLATHLSLVVVVFFASRYREPLQWLPWLGLLLQWLALAGLDINLGKPSLAVDSIEPLVTSTFVGGVAASALLYSLLALWNLSLGRFPHLWASLMCLSPVLWLALLYLRVPAVSDSGYWPLGSLMLGLTYIFVAGKRLLRKDADAVALWLLTAGHAAYSLAVVMAFSEAGLTLALAAQVLSLAWLMRRFELPALGWLMKLVLALVVARLTLNPWLLTYPGDVHWSLWTYGGSTLCCWVAWRVLPEDSDLRHWLGAAGIHLLVLTLGAESRYWLYDGNVFAQRYGFTEAAINTSLWAAMALSYHYRARVSEFMQEIYLGAARVLMGLALLSYTLLLTVNNPYWAPVEIASRPVFNMLLLAYGLPVLLATASYRYYEPRFRRLAGAVAGLALFVFVNLEIRHLWNGSVSSYLPTGNGELYTYSLVWLGMAVVTVLLGTQRALPSVYKAGMALLLLVIAKIFLVDMSDLEGLLRVASFMALGLGLLGLSYLHQRLSVYTTKQGD